MADLPPLREQILARLAIVIAIPGIETALRNVDILDETKLPAVVLHDGDENSRAETPYEAPGPTGGIMVMEPAVELQFATTPEQLGTDGNVWLGALQKAVLFDTKLRTLCRGIPNGGPRYQGCTFAMFPGSDSKGQIVAQFPIAYPFNPRAL